MYYESWFLGSAVFLITVKFLLRVDSNVKSETIVQESTVFKSFQRNYLIVYLIMMAADWLQGPYVYALYQHYGYDMQKIGVLFIVGFATSLVFGAFIGSMADRYGRKNMCIVFGLIYSFSCIIKHSGRFELLLIGRMCGGISTSILFSVFETWMISHHNASGFKDEWLSLTFSLCTSGNGLVAIAAGVVAGVAKDNFGPVAPFDLALIFLLVGTIIIMFTWKENFGNRKVDVGNTLLHAYRKLIGDKKILVLGLIQASFEGSMYIFVFMWTPSLSSTTEGGQILHGWIFATFMIAVLIGSTIFSYLMRIGCRVEKFTTYMLFLAALALFIPSVTVNHSLRLISFLVFEMCCGIYWPALGTMRGKYVPEDVRATITNFFRIPLNLIVVVVLVEIGSMGEKTVFMMCSLLLITGTLASMFFANWTIKAT